MALSQAHQDGDIECQLVCAAHVPVPLDSDDDNNGDCRSEAASESSHFTALSYATDTFGPAYGCYTYGMMPASGWNCNWNSNWNQTAQWDWHPNMPAQWDWPEPDMTVQHSLSQLTTQINEEFSKVQNAIEQITDDRPNRQGQLVGLWRRQPSSICKEVRLPPYLHQLICDRACEFVLDDPVGQFMRDGFGKRMGSSGCVTVQWALVLGNAMEKTMIIRKLKKRATEIIYNRWSGGFVAAQIVMEALVDNDVAVVTEALEFMTVAHDSDNDPGSQLLASMKHCSANHPVRLWIKLLGGLNQNRHTSVNVHIERLWLAVDAIVAKRETMEIVRLAQSQNGCRSLNQLLISFGNTGRMEGVIAQLVSNSDILLDLIRHPFANYIMTTMLQQGIEAPRIIECVKRNFLASACNDHSNYVLTACLESPHCDAHLHQFAAELRMHRKAIDEVNKYRSQRIENQLSEATTIAKARCPKTFNTLQYQ